MENDSVIDTPWIAPEKQKTFLGHPVGLYILFVTEMWERFSYYGMRALLVLYMTNYLIKDPAKFASVYGFPGLRSLLEMGLGPMGPQALASQMYGLYTGFVYLSPFFGGILADKVWGQKKTVYIGGIIMAIGHFLMASQNSFLLALSLLILGNGAFKPNISTQVGNLYPHEDPRKDGAYTIFYMGINVGAALSSLVCGALAEYYGWDYGFGAAGIGMLLGLAAYHFGRHYLPLDKHEMAKMKKEPSQSKGPGFATLTILSFFGIALLFFLILIIPTLFKILLLAAFVGATAFAIGKIADRDDRNRVLALVLLCLGTVIFWAIYEQQGNTLQLWSDQKTDWTFFGVKLPSAFYQFFNPAMIIVFAPILDIIWLNRAKKGKTSTSVRKMGIGCVLCGGAFLIMVLAAKVIGDGDAKGSLMWLVATTLIFTLGELYLSPIGLSLVSKVAPTRMLSMMMGMWLMSSFFGNYLAGYLGMFYETMPKDVFFGMLAAMGVAIGLVFFAAESKMKKVIGEA